MHRNGHVGAALLVYSLPGFIATLFGGLEIGVLGAMVAAGISMVPDWDHRIPFVEHRGITHTAPFAVLVGLVLGAGGLLVAISEGHLTGIGAAAFGFALGFGTIVSHIGADALTPMGVEPFRDNRRYSADLVQSANPVANYALLVLGVGLATVGVIAGSDVRPMLF